eukprot:jgi/Mesvir1/8785/Mv02695-RA.1
MQANEEVEQPGCTSHAQPPIPVASPPAASVPSLHLSFVLVLFGGALLAMFCAYFLSRCARRDPAQHHDKAELGGLLGGIAHKGGRLSALSRSGGLSGLFAVGGALLLFVGILSIISMLLTTSELADIYDYNTEGLQLPPHVGELSCEQINKLHYTKQIGRGYWTRIFVANLNGRALAVKEWSPRKKSSQMTHRLRMMPFKEISFLRAMYGKPNVIQIAGACNSTIVMDFYPRTLESLIYNPEVTLTMRQKLLMARDVARGVQSLHSYSAGPIVHADIRPDQFLVASNGSVVLVDLNRAALLRHGQRGICKTKNKGRWRSPEEYRISTFTEKADIYSMGLVILSIVTGSKSPYGEGVSADDVAAQVRSGSLRPIVPEDLPSELQDLLQECWHRDYRKRLSAREVGDRLDAMIESMDEAGGPATRRL